MTTTPVPNLVDRLRPLWLLLTGGAFVSFAGTALTLFYFWGIGGVPIGQAAGTGAMAKIVLSSALFLAVLFFMAWVAPTIMAHTVADESAFAVRLRHLFSRPLLPNPTPPSPSSGLVVVDDSASAPGGAVPGSVESVSWKRIFVFSFSTVGIGCGGLTLMALGAGRDDGRGWLYCLVAPALMMGGLLAVQWWRFNRSMKGAGDDGRQSGASLEKRWDWLAWAFFGYGSAVLSLFPLLILLLVFIRSDFLLEQESYWAFSAGALVISLGIVAAFAVSLAVLVRRRQGVAVRWAAVLSFNALILLLVVMALGISSRVLEAVMVLSSVRVENAMLLLEPDGCELLQSMQAQGWGRIQGSSEKTCLLYDVTIQSTLEPAMQLACWRGVISNKASQTSAPAPSASGAASSIAAAAASAAASPASAASASPAPTPAKAATVPAVAASQVPSEVVEFSGRNGAFTIPTKLVRSVWKTGGIKLGDQQPVCPGRLTVNVGPGPVQPASSAAASAASSVAK